MHIVGSGKGLDGLAKEVPLPGTSPSAPRPVGDNNDEDSICSSSECPELSVEEMTTMTTDTSSLAHHHPPSSGDGSSGQQTRSLEITTASDSINVTGASNSCKHCHVFIKILILHVFYKY